jgi:hypothetical protein
MMAFRADEAADDGFKAVKNYLIPRDWEEKERMRSEDKLHDIIEKYGPVVSSYPSWHPLVTHRDTRNPVTTPGTRCGYKDLDHTRYFVNAFITCPYGNGQKLIDAVDALPFLSYARIKAERLDVKFYNPKATPILVTCDWKKSLPYNRMIPAALAVPLMLQKELPCWEYAQVGETWQTMRHYFLGAPHGSRSSLFVDQETAMIMKKIWELMINTGMFGPLMVSDQH